MKIVFHNDFLTGVLTVLWIFSTVIQQQKLYVIHVMLKTGVMAAENSALFLF